eukprot:scaffold1619_cov242-Prasinococcus_capsulatus_cf.AAC.5
MPGIGDAKPALKTGVLNCGCVATAAIPRKMYRGSACGRPRPATSSQQYLSLATAQQAIDAQESSNGTTSSSASNRRCKETAGHYSA